MFHIHANLKLLLFFVLALGLQMSGCGCSEDSESTPGEDTDSGLDTDDPIVQEWMGSGHADASAEAFVHWNEEDPAVIPVECAGCHSTSGYLDLLGEDGSEAGIVDNEVEVTDPNEVVACNACHNDSAEALDEVTFPSGAVVAGLGAEARCMMCHQGRSSGPGVDEATADMEDDTVNEELGFINIHYFAAGATKYGTEVKGAYEYADMGYDGYWQHVEGESACNQCHNPHSLEVNVEECADCHTDVTTVADAQDIRMAGSFIDYDGDSNIEEGIAKEISGLAAKLLVQIQAYAEDNGDAEMIAYSPTAYPYFFIDTNGDGEADEDEATYANQYATWTPRLLKGAYNYQYAKKDTGAYAHNPKYVIQVLVDSFVDLGGDADTVNRDDLSHFGGQSEAFRHWDEDVDEETGEPIGVEPACARCHATAGAQYYVQNDLEDTPDPVPASYGLSCEVCHSGFSGGNAPVHEIASVTFPSGITIDNDGDNPDSSFMCMSCHQGRESKKTIDDAIAADDLGFRNVHYVPAGAIQYGTAALVGYEYDSNTYTGAFAHAGAAAPTTCSYCHLTAAKNHSFEPILDATCVTCHDEATEGVISSLRKNRDMDYDGDGDTTEPLADELMSLGDALYAQIQTFANADAALSAIVYSSAVYPYWFIDTNEDGIADEDEINYGNQYDTWTADMMKAGHNYQIWVKELGAWAHNTDYMAQLLIDANVDLGGDVTMFNRPDA